MTQNLAKRLFNFSRALPIFRCLVVGGATFLLAGCPLGEAMQAHMEERRQLYEDCKPFFKIDRKARMAYKRLNARRQQDIHKPYDPYGIHERLRKQQDIPRPDDSYNVHHYHHYQGDSKDQPLQINPAFFLSMSDPRCAGEFDMFID